MSVVVEVSRVFFFPRTSCNHWEKMVLRHVRLFFSSLCLHLANKHPKIVPVKEKRNVRLTAVEYRLQNSRDQSNCPRTARTNELQSYLSSGLVEPIESSAMGPFLFFSFLIHQSCTKKAREWSPRVKKNATSSLSCQLSSINRSGGRWTVSITACRMHRIGSQWPFGERHLIHIQVLGNEIRIDHVAMNTFRNGVVEIGFRSIVMDVSHWLGDLKFLNGNGLIVLRTLRKAETESERDRRLSRRSNASTDLWICW